MTFFADMMIQVLTTAPEDLDRMEKILQVPNNGYKCIYLAEQGCLWNIKPIVCEMFLCDEAREKVLGASEDLARRWEDLRQRERLFTRPTQPVIFDDLERLFMEAGLESPLMYFHRSPGLLRLKAKHGLASGEKPRRVQTRSDEDRQEE